MSRSVAPKADPWVSLRRLTPARIALGRAGAGLPTAEALEFRLAHAHARDAVHCALDVPRLDSEFRAAGYETLRVKSAAPDRTTYLRRPDLGRRLSEASAEALRRLGPEPADLCFVAVDGLSAVAAERHALRLLLAFRAVAPSGWTQAPVVIAEQGRVALGDEVGELLHARLVAVLIGERPGLTSPDSLGVYITFAPRVGRTDAERNCISNIRPEGLPYEPAAGELAWLVSEALRRGFTGVGLKGPAAGAPPQLARGTARAVGGGQLFLGSVGGGGEGISTRATAKGRGAPPND